MRTEIRGTTEIRFKDDGSLDEVIHHDPVTGTHFHLERLEDHLFWMKITSPDPASSIAIQIGTVKSATPAKVVANHEWDS